MGVPLVVEKVVYWAAKMDFEKAFQMDVMWDVGRAGTSVVEKEHARVAL
jgi:hypothetical protein